MDSRALWILLVFANILLADADDPAIDAIFLRLFKKNGTYIDKNIKNVTQLIANIDTTQETSLFINGWKETIDSEDVQLITGAYLQATDDNVLAVDYRKLSKRLYTTSVSYVEPIGKALANSLNSMFDAGLNPMKLHIIGHSLGAHVAGNVGRNLKVKIPRITALDAAGPLF
ncbi:lipoprotein lipase-like [Ceratina calcarata]|uniref:phospholipase A1 n=1 Tax=Ceratina calcarata TaxID=156304 RepID=A0AAJ7W831_9HYME|nr:lipoprotein lipase-like [Ceratina calcarata]